MENKASLENICKIKILSSVIFVTINCLTLNCSQIDILAESFAGKLQKFEILNDVIQST